jgi:hypothetical protein
MIRRARIVKFQPRAFRLQRSERRSPLNLFLRFMFE